MSKIAYTLREAAEAVSVSGPDISGAIRNGALIARAVSPREVIISAVALAAWVESLPDFRDAA